MRSRNGKRLAALVAGLVALATAGAGQAVADTVADPAGLPFVALGSSFAAGPGIKPTQAGTAASDCERSNDNYANQLGRDLGANLTDVSCSSATTNNVLVTGQHGQPAQINAVQSGTKLVTLTIGGNDVGYVGSLIQDAQCTARNTNTPDNIPACSKNPSGNYDAMKGNIKNVIAEIRSRAGADVRVLLFTYFKILPDFGSITPLDSTHLCANVPLTSAQWSTISAAGTEVNKKIREAARESTGTTVIDMEAESTATDRHDVCAADSWIFDYSAPSGKWHPTEEGMGRAAQLVKSTLVTLGLTAYGSATSGFDGKCLSVKGGSSDPGTPVRVYPCSDIAAQKWAWTPASGGSLRAVKSCVTVTAVPAANGTLVEMDPCSGARTQRWTRNGADGLRNPQSGLCLTAPADGGTGQLFLSTCTGSATQRWGTPA
ncbi:ricin-type beta-trefoil lectin domain protein [Actinokineospora bangkokensis]|uniref:Ricin B lectin domain-containing protein n=1 Tax=Actinokineospora bangkokensis TaxID=1193682 RepID=A0A1Q9LQU2_9PSEU|nr:ricin-type beta-trefoil lectin domain protein [Actinokineospora bangkokensis]OLR94361.1 hypothetical protein BJP25_11385 [Actinokineospora bangkokensis]